MNIEPADLIQYGATIVTVIGVWYKDVIGRKLGIKKEVKSLEASALENVQRNLDIYQEMITDIDSRYKEKLRTMESEFIASLDRMKEEVESLRVLNAELTVFVSEQKTIISKQSKRIDYFKKKYNELD